MKARFDLIGVLLLVLGSLLLPITVVNSASSDSGGKAPREPRSLKQVTAGDTWSFSSVFSSLRNYIYNPEPVPNQLSSARSAHASYEFPTENLPFLHRPPPPPTPPQHPPLPPQATGYITPPQWNIGNIYARPAIINNQTCGNQFIGQCQRTNYRSIDGSCNNLDNPTWGMAQTRYTRLLPAIYSDGVWAPPTAASGGPLPRSRVLSYTLFPEVRIKDPRWTLATMQWGQVMTHDMAELQFSAQRAAACCTNDNRLVLNNLNDPQCWPIVIGPEDPDYRGIQCQPFGRAMTDQSLGCPAPQGAAEQITAVTQFLDLSLVYSSSDQLAANLRSFIGGRLRTEVRNQREWPPTTLNVTAMTCDRRTPSDFCYLGGDSRINQNTQLTVLHIILLREHNRIAGALSRINPHWNDETIYQETRRIMMAIHQHISYVEWLPIILGTENTRRYKLVYDTDDYVDDYDPSVNPSVLNEHSNAAFRVFHSLVAGYLKFVMENRSASPNLLRLSDWFLRPSIIEQADNMDALTRGLADQPQQASDEFYDKEITVFLFRDGKVFGQDLRSFDIQRNRDHGLATYNDYREFCGLRRARTWADFSDTITPQNIDKLSRLYEVPDDVDLTVGGSLEENTPGTLAGPTFLCILIEQFYRTRVGDRFWYESPNPDVAFTREQLREIRKSSIARLFCDNSGNVQNMQRKAFELPSPRNPITRCENIPVIDLTLWKDFAPSLAAQPNVGHPGHQLNPHNLVYGPEPAVSIENESKEAEDMRVNRQKRKVTEEKNFDTDSSEEAMRNPRATSSYTSSSSKDDYRGYSGRKIYRSYPKSYRQPRRKYSSRRFDSEEFFDSKVDQKSLKSPQNIDTIVESPPEPKTDSRKDRSTSIELHSASSAATAVDSAAGNVAASSATSASSSTDIVVSTDTGTHYNTPITTDKIVHLDANVGVATASSLSVDKNIGIGAHSSSVARADSGTSLNSARRYHDRHPYPYECSDEDDLEYARRCRYSSGRRYGTRHRDIYSNEDYYVDSKERFYHDHRRRYPHRHGTSDVSLNTDAEASSSTNLEVGGVSGGLSSSTSTHADAEVNVDLHTGRHGRLRRPGSYEDFYDPEYCSGERYYDEYRRRRPYSHRNSGVSLHAESESSSATNLEVGGITGGLSSSTNVHADSEVNVDLNAENHRRLGRPNPCEEVYSPDYCSEESYYDYRRRRPHYHGKSGVSLHAESETSASANLNTGSSVGGISSSTSAQAESEIDLGISTDSSPRSRYHKLPRDYYDDRLDDVACDESNGGAYLHDSTPYVCDDCRRRLCGSSICPICGKPDFFRLKKKRSVADEMIYHFAKANEDVEEDEPASGHSVHYLDLDLDCSGREMYMNPQCQDSNINLETEDGNLVSLGYVRAHLNHGHDFAIGMQNRGKTLVMSGMQPEPHTPSMLHFLDNQVNERLIKLNEESELTLFGTKLLQQSLSNEYKLTPNTFTSFLNEHGFHVSGNKICRRQLRECGNYEKYRSMDGSCNNLHHPTWGQSNTAFARILPPRYADGIHAMPKSILGGDLPNPRDLSVKFFRRGKREDSGLTLAVMQWGQILAHDFGRQVTDQTINGGIECCMEKGEGVLPDVLQHHSCSPIIISEHDKFYSAHGQRCMNFVRSMTVPSEDCTLGPAQLLNAATSYLDCSFVYGPDKSASDELREFRGGRLKIEFRRGNWVLPRNHNRSHLTCDTFSPEDFCYASGDARTNQNPQLVILQTLLVREHNRLADGLATFNPHWNDEKLFQEARRILIAQYQHITYNEWLPILLGNTYCENHGLSPFGNKTHGEYNPNVNPSTTLGFTSGAFRFLHTLIDGDINFYTPKRDIIGTTRLSEHYFRPRMIEEDNNFECLLRGLTTQPLQGSDTYLHRDITEYLFKSQNNYGMDLMAVDIQRGRDHGVSGYNEYRRICKMRVAKNFDDFTGEISQKNLDKLKRTYAHVDDIDLIVGVSMEPRIPDALLGPTNRCLMAEQFYRTRVGDRYFYDHRTTRTTFTAEQLKEIKKVTLSRLMCNMGPAVSTIQPEAFKSISPSNSLINCEKLEKLNLKFWKA